MLSSNLLEIELSFQTCEFALRGLVERFRLASKFLHKLTQAEADFRLSKTFEFLFMEKY